MEQARNNFGRWAVRPERLWVIYFLLLSIFLLLLCFFFPTDANRWLFIVASIDFLVLEFMKLTAREKDKFTNRQIAFF